MSQMSEQHYSPAGVESAQGSRKRDLALVSRSTYMKEKALQYHFFACAFLAVVTVILIFAFTTMQAAPVFTAIGLANFFSFTWAPTEGHYGILSLAAGTALVTVGALVLGVPLGVGTAVYLTEIASARVRALISPAVDLLAGIPSIIYGFFGMVIIRPFVADLTGGLGFGALTAWFVLAIMIVPTITTLTIDALNSIPMGIREASRGEFRHGRHQMADHLQGRASRRQVRHRRRRRARHGPRHRRDHGCSHGRGQRAGHSRVHLQPGLHAHEPDRARHELLLRLASHRPVRHGRGAVLFIVSAALVGIVRLLSKMRKG